MLSFDLLQLDVVNYLKTYRLQWGQPDRRSLLLSSLEGLTAPHDDSNATETYGVLEPTVPLSAPRYFMANISPELISIILNDWPYSGASYKTDRLTSPHPALMYIRYSPSRDRARINMD